MKPGGPKMSAPTSTPRKAGACIFKISPQPRTGATRALRNRPWRPLCSDHIGRRNERGRLGIYSGSDRLVSKREEPIPGERVKLRARLSVALGSAVLACFAAYLVLPSATKPTRRHKYFPSLPQATSRQLCRNWQASNWRDLEGVVRLSAPSYQRRGRATARGLVCVWPRRGRPTMQPTRSPSSG